MSSRGVLAKRQPRNSEKETAARHFQRFTIKKRLRLPPRQNAAFLIVFYSSPLRRNDNVGGNIAAAKNYIEKE